MRSFQRRYKFSVITEQILIATVLLPEDKIILKLFIILFTQEDILIIILQSPSSCRSRNRNLTAPTTAIGNACGTVFSMAVPEPRRIMRYWSCPSPWSSSNPRSSPWPNSLSPISAPFPGSWMPPRTPSRWWLTFGATAGIATIKHFTYILQCFCSG
jgi:hypothetical protein